MGSNSCLRSMFNAYARYIVRWPTKLGVLALTAVIFGFSVKGNIDLRHEFDPMLFLPKDCYLKLFVDWRNK